MACSRSDLSVVSNYSLWIVAHNAQDWPPSHASQWKINFMRFLIHRNAMCIDAEGIVAKPSKSLLLLIENSNASCAPDIECMQCSIQYNHIRLRRKRPGRFGNRLHALQV